MVTKEGETSIQTGWEQKAEGTLGNSGLMHSLGNAASVCALGSGTAPRTIPSVKSRPLP